MPRRTPVCSILSGTAGRTLLETVLVLFFVLLLLIVVVDRFNASIASVKEAALRIELSNMRSGVNLFAMTKKRLPASIEELVNEKIVVNKQGIDGAEFKVEMVGKYVEGMTVGEGGVPLDPFGNSYTLDPANGMVKTTTSGYESW
jgi:competence protein ComGC